MNRVGIITLAPNSVGAALMTRVIEDGEIDRLTSDIVKPFYQDKLNTALTLVDHYLGDLPVRVHRPDGAFFLWLWMEDCPITSEQSYQKLKGRHVYMIPGEAFFMGIDPDWPHSKQCMRLNYAQSQAQVERGLSVLAEELHAAYSG